MKSFSLHSLGACLMQTAVALLVATSGMASVTVTVNSNGGSPFATSAGSLLSMGSAVRVGFFNISGVGNLSVLQTSNVYADVNALFTPLAESHANSGVVNEMDATGDMLIINDMFATGDIFGQITNIDASYCTPGTALWVWVFNNADPLLATEWGIFTASTGWDFPLDLGSTVLSTSEVNNVVRGTDTGSQLQLSGVSVIPEPGSLLLILASGLVLRRRRLP